MRRWWRYGPPEAKWLPGLVWRRHVAEFAVRLANQHKAGRKSGQQGSGQGDGELMSAAGRSNRDMTKQTSRVYQTISGRHIPMSKLNKVEKELLTRVQQKYNSRLEWTRFAAWWNAEFSKTGLSGVPCLSGSVARSRPNFLQKWCKATVDTRTLQVRSRPSAG